MTEHYITLHCITHMHTYVGTYVPTYLHTSINHIHTYRSYSMCTYASHCSGCVGSGILSMRWDLIWTPQVGDFCSLPLKHASGWRWSWTKKEQTKSPNLEMLIKRNAHNGYIHIHIQYIYIFIISIYIYIYIYIYMYLDVYIAIYNYI